MAPPIQLTQETSTFETIYPTDSGASESAKLIKIARGYKSRAIDLAKVVNINVSGYINTESQMNSVTEKNERAAMRGRMNSVRDSLIQMGVSNDKIWIAGVAYSSNWGGQINVSIREVNLNFIILPPFTPYVPSNDPQNSPDAKEQWLDAEAATNVDVVKKEMTTEIEVSLKEGGIFRKKPPISVKMGFKPDGSLGEIGAEWTIIEEEIKKKAMWGAIQEIKIKVTASASAEFEKEDTQQIKTTLNAKLKGSLGANLVIPGTNKLIPVEASIGVGIDGKPEFGLQFTIFKW